jgi:hypothetical protein
MKRILLYIFWVLNAAAWHNCLAGTEFHQRPGIILPGALVKATALAYAQFEQELDKQGKAATNDFARSMSKLESYDAKISVEHRHYIIRFIPKDKNVRGGAIAYTIKKDDFSISDIEYSK